MRQVAHTFSCSQTQILLITMYKVVIIILGWDIGHYTVLRYMEQEVSVLGT